MLNKQKVYNHFSTLLSSKIEFLQKLLNDLKESGAGETKSTAGDKHETALAMIQIEQANKRVQMQELLSQKAVLNKINPQLQTSVVVTGSLIKTSAAHYFISIAMGKAMIDGEEVIALSAQSPLGKILMGSQKGAHVSFNQIHLLIEDIV